MSKTNNKKTKGLILAAVIAVVLLALVILLLPGQTQEPEQTEAPAVETTVAPETEAYEAPVLKEALRIDEIGNYTGIYVEDGSDEAVTGLLMMIVTNITEEPIQYAKIDMDVNGKTAEFAVSVLPVGASAVLIEQKRMEFDESFDYSQTTVECRNLAGFDKPLSLQEDKLEIQVLDGAINIMNISGADIPETVVLCYKNVSNGVYHGGIAYRVRLEGGLKDGEIRQIMGTHFHQSGSQILFVDLIP